MKGNNILASGGGVGDDCGEAGMLARMAVAAEMTMSRHHGCLADLNSCLDCQKGKGNDVF
jgi:hypothetical protein